jgi:hypothetical protein
MSPVMANFAGGVVSSLVAVALVETYLRLRRVREQRALARALGFRRSTCSIVPTRYDREPGSPPLTGARDAVALAYVLNACHAVRTEPVVEWDDPMDGLFKANLVSIGSWSGNQLTASLMRQYCPGFVTHNAAAEHTDFASIHYSCGPHVFASDADVTHAFIVRLTTEKTGIPGSVTLLWGHYGVGTIAAAHVLTGTPELLTPFLARGSFAVALTANRKLGYRAVSRNLIDLTDHAFTAPLP